MKTRDNGPVRFWRGTRPQKKIGLVGWLLTYALNAWLAFITPHSLSYSPRRREEEILFLTARIALLFLALAGALAQLWRTVVTPSSEAKHT